MTVLGRYQSLRDQIEEHKYYLSERAGREIPVKEAAADWYDHVYLPTIRIIEESHILKDFPHRTSADLYVWIMDHKYHLGERYGFDVGIRRATKDFISLIKALSLRLTNSSSPVDPPLKSEP
ncbi:hypothetical protein HKBW3S06_01409 [Candidatus Hakubella thermalkaliphila]|uniref:DUF4032 domain-containing protein n=1 Tax=Candidatus Hakubella thermalkaliphila TaxID=2754717 RepID=A0A6V8NPC9_9ACTN|nr:DUF4032 domain-containing protein [Candidatus Hakubella thermalkaliphila]GFP22182.1 hypothetical protein HKBW3S06_01409 [Candidatus Hakubella thermalkaliphila]